MPPSACASWHRAALHRDWQARWSAADRSRELARARRRSHPQPGHGCFRPGSTRGRRGRLDVGTTDAAAFGRRASVAAIAAYVSYGHAYAVVRAHGETGITA